MAITQKEHFIRVLAACGFDETVHGTTIKPYYDDALHFLQDSGIPESVAKTEETIGCVARYILDTYNYNSGTVQLSDFFFFRLRQLMAKYDRGGVE